MPSRGALKDQAQEIRAKVEGVMADASLSDADRKSKIADLGTEFKTVQDQIATFDAAAEITKGGDGQVTEAGPDVFRASCRNLSQIKGEVAANFINSPQYAELVKSLGGKPDEFGAPRKQFTENFEMEAKKPNWGGVTTKDATAGANQMGEAFYGQSGVGAPAGGFLPGAFGPGILPTFIPGIVEQRFYPTSIADLIPSFEVSTPILSYLTESTAVFNAGPVPEGGLYPFSSEEFSRFTEEVGKISNAAVVTDEVIRDAPQLFAFLQGRIVEGIQRQEEVQLLAGSGGTNGGVSGLLNRSAGFTKGTTGIAAATNVVFPAANTPGLGANPATIASLTYGRQATVDPTKNTGLTAAGLAISLAVHQAIVDIQTSVFYSPNAIVMNPADWATVRTATDVNGQFYGGSMFGSNYGYAANAGETLWNCRVVATPAMPLGNVLVGYFDASTIQSARREGISVQMTNTNQDNFVKGQVTVRGEERLGLLTYRPSAFELVSVVNAQGAAA